MQELYISPGNVDTSQGGENVNISVNDFETLGKFELEKNIKMIVVGLEEPLVKGIVDYFKKRMKD